MSTIAVAGIYTAGTPSSVWGRPAQARHETLYAYAWPGAIFKLTLDPMQIRVSAQAIVCAIGARPHQVMHDMVYTILQSLFLPCSQGNITMITLATSEGS